mmetsp:Transcript_22405/g.72725  ORF Transcript_22405/g.72725 Transcript_22405/m.72725 type:complete len:256 (-) Transcript_22405:1032-1799(-)
MRRSSGDSTRRSIATRSGISSFLKTSAVFTGSEAPICANRYKRSSGVSQSRTWRRICSSIPSKSISACAMSAATTMPSTATLSFLFSIDMMVERRSVASISPSIRASAAGCSRASAKRAALHSSRDIFRIWATAISFETTTSSFAFSTPLSFIVRSISKRFAASRYFCRSLSSSIWVRTLSRVLSSTALRTRAPIVNSRFRTMMEDASGDLSMIHEMCTRCASVSFTFSSAKVVIRSITSIRSVSNRSSNCKIVS